MITFLVRMEAEGEDGNYENEDDDGDCDDCDDDDIDNDILRSAGSIGGFHKSMSLISFSKIVRKKGYAIFKSLSSLTLTIDFFDQLYGNKCFSQKHNRDKQDGFLEMEMT